MDHNCNLTRDLDKKFNFGDKKALVLFEIFEHVSNCNCHPLSDLVRNCNFGPFRMEIGWSKIVCSKSIQHVILNFIKKFSGPEFAPRVRREKFSEGIFQNQIIIAGQLYYG